MTSFENSKVHFRYLVKMALKQKVSWISLKTFLKELISSFESSKQLNEVLLEELQSLHSKTIENLSETMQSTAAKEQEPFNETEVGMLRVITRPVRPDP